MRDFDDLVIFREAFQLSIEIETELRNAGLHWSVTNQLRRSINSVADNIAEGCMFDSARVLRRHCFIALGSLGEAQIQHRRLRILGDLPSSQINERRFDALRRQIHGFIRYLDKKANPA